MRAKVVCRLKKFSKYVSLIQSDYHRCFYTAANHCNQYEAPLAPTSAPCLLLLHSSLGNGMMTIYTLLIYFFVAPP